jgi:TATA-box binding protein (TBP) (component of TFIID and TFIIIB)
MQHFKPSELKIATMTCISNFGTQLDIKVLAKFLKIKSIIQEIRYRDYTKNSSGISKYKKVSFYNQITLVIFYNNEKNNVKIFSNGQVQVTGCKSLENLTKMLHKLIEIIYSTSQVYSIPVFQENGLVIGYDNCIYSLNKIIGYKTGENTYLINNEQVIFNKNELISSACYNKTKFKYIYNFSGDKIGEKYLEFYNQKRLKHKNTRLIDGKVYNLKNQVIGEEKINIINEKIENKLEGIEKIVARFKATEENSIVLKNPVIVNINSVYDCNCELDRDELFDTLHPVNRTVSQQVF